MESEAQQLASQFTSLSLELANLLQSIWHFTAFVTLGAIGWGVSTRRREDPPEMTTRALVAFGLAIFYSLNTYVLWTVMQRFHSAQRIAKTYTEQLVGSPNPEFDIVFQTLDNSLLIGTGVIQASVVLIVFLLMGPLGRVKSKPLPA